MELKTKKLDNKWYIEVETEEFGCVLLLDNSGLPVALAFDTEEDANQYVKNCKLWKEDKNGKTI